MTEATIFTDLADRAERLAEPCRQTDCEIAAAIGWVGVSHNGEIICWHDPKGIPRDDIPYFTGLLDAAKTLVPRGRYWHVGHGRTRNDEPLGGASIIEAGTLFTIAEAEAQTAELALTAAALRALAYDTSRARTSAEAAHG